MSTLLFAAALLGAATAARFRFAADKGSTTGAGSAPDDMRVNRPARPPAVTGTPEAQADGQRRRIDRVHLQQLATLNRDRAANGLPPLTEVPGYFADAPKALTKEEILAATAAPPTGFAAQGQGRPVGTGGELGTSNERASVGKVPVGSSDVAVAQVERSVAQDQPKDGGAGTVPSNELQASAPLIEPTTGKPVEGSPQEGLTGATGPAGAAGAEGADAPTGPQGDQGPDGDPHERRQSARREAEQIEKENTREALVDLAAQEGVEVHSSDTKAVIAKAIVDKRRAK